MTPGLSSYVDVSGYLRSAANQETASLLGLTTTAAGASQPAGTTTLAVADASGWAAGPCWVLDGPWGEVVQVTGSPDGTHLALAAPGTAFAHASGASVSQAGGAGALAEVILRASAWIEGYCQQGTLGGDRSLYAVSRTERWSMPSTRAHLDRDRVVVVRPGHFPVQSVSALAIELGQGQTLSFDVSQVELPTAGRIVELPYLLGANPTAGQLLLESRGLSRTRRQWVVLTYVGGFTPGAVPYDVQQACAWVVSDLLGQRQNPTGAAELRLGKKALLARQRGDLSGDSVLILRARDALESYKEREP